MVSAAPTHNYFSVRSNGAFATSVFGEKIRTTSTALATALTDIVALADIGIGAVLCLFYPFARFYIKKKTEIKFRLFACCFFDAIKMLLEYAR